jgi:hypothetical protein
LSGYNQEQRSMITVLPNPTGDEKLTVTVQMTRRQLAEIGYALGCLQRETSRNLEYLKADSDMFEATLSDLAFLRGIREQWLDAMPAEYFEATEPLA